VIARSRQRFGLPPDVRMLYLGLVCSLAMVAVIVFGIPLQWQNPSSEFVHNGATYPLPVVFLVTQGTFLLSLLLLLIPGEKHRSFALGTALLTSVLFLVPCDAVNAGITVFMLFSTKGWEVAFFLLSWLLIPAHVLVVAGSWRLLKRMEVNASLFAAGLILVVVYASVTVWGWTTVDHRFRTAREQAVKEARAAHDSVKAISWCAYPVQNGTSARGLPAQP
jgi:hypothetical protein